MQKGVLIVGGGQGGFQAAVSLRSEGYSGPVSIVGDEPHLPYQRPPLSKGMLTGKQQSRHAILRPAAFYQTHDIELIPGQRVAAIEPHLNRVKLESGLALDYDHLILATGARNRLLPVEGAAAEGVCYLRTLDEASHLIERLQAAQQVAVIGGGFIGLEVAAAASTLSKQVTVIEAQPRLMARVLAPVVSEYFHATHTGQGAVIELNSAVRAIETHANKATGVLLADGSRIPADLIVVGIGVVPNLELARDAGLATANGIVVDQHLRTADPSIFAIGDAAEYPNIYAQSRVRLESVQNAVDHAAAVAKHITGHASPYDAVPWFWTDQHDIRLQMTGIALTFDQVITRGDPQSGNFSVFYYRAGELLAIDSINRPAEHLIARKLIAARVHPTPEAVADESFDLNSALESYGP